MASTPSGKIFQRRELFGKCITHKDDGRPMVVYPTGRIIFDEPLADTRLMTVQSTSLDGSVEDYQVLPESRCQKAFAWHKSYARYMRGQDDDIYHMSHRLGSEDFTTEDRIVGKDRLVKENKQRMLLAIERLNDE